MPAISRSGGDPLRRHWWAVLLLILAIGGWVSLPFLRDHAGDSASANRGPAVSEQSLDSLDTGPDAFGAPGQPLASDNAAGAEARKSGTAGAADGASTASAAADAKKAAGKTAAGVDVAGAAGAESGDTLAGALARLAHAGKRPADAQPRTDAAGSTASAAQTGGGFSPPHASFGSLSGLSGGASSNGTSASASWAPFGMGQSRPAETVTVGVSPAHADPAPRNRGGKNLAMNALQDMQSQTNRAAVMTNAERAAGVVGGGFDASGQNATLASRQAGGGAVIGGLDSIPENLKDNDPSLQRRDLTPPKVPGPSRLPKTKEEMQQEMEQQLEQVMIQAAVGGILGPLFGGMGGGLAAAMGYDAASSGNYYGSATIVKDRYGNLVQGTLVH